MPASGYVVDGRFASLVAEGQVPAPRVKIERHALIRASCSRKGMERFGRIAQVECLELGRPTRGDKQVVGR
jgi:hypothetical protein